MTPFGWRFAGALAGVLMLPGMYLLGKLTKRRMGAFAAMFLMAVDTMHFTQTRIATIDSFVVLFIIWSYVFMVYYLRMDYWRKPLIKTLIPLALSGLFMGMAVASKWTGCFAGVGLAVLFFWSVWRRSREHLAASHELEAYEVSQQKVNHKLRKPHPEESKLAVPARTSCTAADHPGLLPGVLHCRAAGRVLCILYSVFPPLGRHYGAEGDSGRGGRLPYHWCVWRHVWLSQHAGAWHEPSLLFALV
ncbi:MAG: phospholipid carrier-dependent glycosyltransferase [Christensenellales bacterium]